LILAGVDEAGRGSVLGPLVVAGVSIDEANIPKLSELGVKDSKLLVPEKRRYLYREIRKLATGVVWDKVEPSSIDRVVFAGKKLFRLNYLEAQHMAHVLLKLEYDLAYVDCCDTDENRFGQLICNIMAEQNGTPTGLGEKNFFVERLCSEHHADRNYPVVAAASIVAKVRRDSCIVRLHKSHGSFGSGYPSDPQTVAYLKRRYKGSKDFSPITRRSWLTVRRMTGETIGRDQRDIRSFTK
jgi:ribonuclease HII